VENISKNEPKRQRDIFYYRQRFKNRVFARIISFFAEEAERTGISKKDIAQKLKRDPAQITRWLSSPSNLTLETISDILLALDSEPEPLKIVRFQDRAKRNYFHPLIAKAIGVQLDAPKGGRPYINITTSETTKTLSTTSASVTPVYKHVFTGSERPKEKVYG